MLKSMQFSSNMNTTTNSKMQDSIDLHNLFLNYKEPAQSNRRSISTMDYAQLRNEKIMELTKSPMQAIDETAVYSSSVVGVIPKYKIKSTYKDKVKPFFTTKRLSLNNDSQNL